MSRPRNQMTPSPEPVFALASAQDALGPDYKKRYVAVAPNGGRKTTKDHPHLPMTPQALAETAKSSLDAGAAMMHVHVRDTAGRHSLDPEAYAVAFNAIRAAVGDGLVLQMTTEALGIFSPDAQRSVVKEVAPEAASLAFREFAKTEADKEAFAALLGWMHTAGVAAQIILYDEDDIVRLKAFMTDFDIQPEETSVLYVLGRYSNTPQGLEHLRRFLNADAPAFRDIMTCAFGAEEAACMTAAALFGSHMRVGFENNLWLPNGTLANDNADLVRCAASSIQNLGYSTGDASGLRALWQL